jgi:hypothetical protein
MPKAARALEKQASTCGLALSLTKRPYRELNRMSLTFSQLKVMSLPKQLFITNLNSYITN